MSRRRAPPRRRTSPRPRRSRSTGGAKTIAARRLSMETILDVKSEILDFPTFLRRFENSQNRRRGSIHLMGPKYGHFEPKCARRTHIGPLLDHLKPVQILLVSPGTQRPRPPVTGQREASCLSNHRGFSSDLNHPTWIPNSSSNASGRSQKLFLLVGPNCPYFGPFI